MVATLSHAKVVPKIHLNPELCLAGHSPMPCLDCHGLFGDPEHPGLVGCAARNMSCQEHEPPETADWIDGPTRTPEPNRNQTSAGSAIRKFRDLPSTGSP